MLLSHSPLSSCTLSSSRASRTSCSPRRTWPIREQGLKLKRCCWTGGFADSPLIKLFVIGLQRIHTTRAPSHLNNEDYPWLRKGIAILDFCSQISRMLSYCSVNSRWNTNACPRYTGIPCRGLLFSKFEFSIKPDLRPYAVFHKIQVVFYKKCAFYVF